MIDFKKIPTPKYGNFGGAGHSMFGRKPIDPMDELFKDHDESYFSGGELSADITLVQGLTKLDKSTLMYPIYGKVYRLGAIIVFKALIKIKGRYQ